MNREKQKRPGAWRIIVFIISLLFIAFMWVKKDIAGMYSTMPEEQVAPLIATTVAVSLLKVVAITVGVLLIRWVVGKAKKR